MKTKAQIKKQEQTRLNVKRLLSDYERDPELGKKMARLTGALYLSISVVDLCQQEIDSLTYNLMIPARLRKAIKDLSTACDRVIRAEEKNELMITESETFQQLADDGRAVKDLMISMTGLTWDSFTKVSAYARNLALKEQYEHDKNKEAV